VKILRLLPVVLCLLSIALASCETDSWKARIGMKDTDHVAVTKVTAYGKPADDGTIYKDQVGTVIFPHKTHEDEAGLKCEYCHHKKGNDDRIKQCAVCHNGYAGFDTMHGLCVDCHISRANGPQKCMQCHQNLKHASLR
jgi:hypothetical protein